MEEGLDLLEALSTSVVDPKATPAPSSATASAFAPRKSKSDPFLDPVSGIRVDKRVLGRDGVGLLLQGRKHYDLGILTSMTRGALESQDPMHAWATSCIIVGKSPSRQASNGGRYSIWKVTTLHKGCEELSLFVFGDAFSQHRNLGLGTVLLLLSPKPLPKRGKDMSLALSVYEGIQLNRVGHAMDFGMCVGKRRDGQPCSMAVNTRLGHVCKFHIMGEMKRKEAKERQAKGKGKPKGNTFFPPPAPGNNSLRPKSASGGLSAIIAKARDDMRSAQGIKQDLHLPKTANSAARGALGKGQGGKVATKPARSQLPGQGKAGLKLRDSLANRSKTAGCLTSQQGNAPVKKKVKADDDFLGSKPSGFALSLLDPEAFKESKAAEAKAKWHQGKKDGSVIVPEQSFVFDRVLKPVTGPLDNVLASRELAKKQQEVLKRQAAHASVKKRLAAKGIHLTGAIPDPSTFTAKHGTVVASGKKRKLPTADKGEVPVKTGSVLVPTGLLGKRLRGMTAAQLEQLGEAVSAHQDDVDAAVYSKAEKAMGKLAEKEQLAQKMQEVTKRKVKAYRCRECDCSYERPPQLCAQRGHHVKAVQGTMRFFNCGDCGARTTTISLMLPPHGCQKCGSSSWKRCSAWRGTEMAKGRELVTALTEGTSKADLVTLAIKS